MKRNGRAEQTTERTIDLLTRLSKSVNLCNPEATKAILANLEWKDTTKKMTAYILKAFYEYLEIPYVKPEYRTKRELPFIPTEKELDLSIASGIPTTATRPTNTKRNRSKNRRIRLPRMDAHRHPTKDNLYYRRKRKQQPNITTKQQSLSPARMPLDVKTMFEAQKKAEELAKGFDFRMGDQNKELIQLLCKLPTESYRKVSDEVSKLLAVEILRQQIATAKTT